ncbi:glutaredoxin family protein [Rummeliibacillus sp. G93]|uniref:Thiol-disulfide isomerase n=1 Tax=Rummeliibacillus stabekisii TaxID=241244 RepID=A0A143HED3_9BACL|nr:MULTISPECIES: glutaredoxin family protein [Rummeliibacillus]AMW99799.1 thiol-disulfide isomerase [Rummeliibacillus stabekisii]MCM3317210.1 glutaredoxin family protein [Rummeliibacillus stabekisii]UQW96697.1 glutaredoxin family protein [Rummeliibacillus sp. G93]
MEITYYSRPNCGLCEEGKLLLKLVCEDFPFQLNEINIEEDEEIHEKYMLMIPVVMKNNEIIQYGQLDYVTLLEGIQE